MSLTRLQEFSRGFQEYDSSMSENNTNTTLYSYISLTAGNYHLTLITVRYITVCANGMAILRMSYGTFSLIRVGS